MAAFRIVSICCKFCGFLIESGFRFGDNKGETEERGAKKKSNEPDRVSRT